MSQAISIHPPIFASPRRFHGPDLKTPFLSHAPSNYGSRFSMRRRVHRSEDSYVVSANADYAGNVPKFAQVNVWDPYKRLGVTPDASEEEIRGARNFLLQQYAEHERSAESIEAAYEKIIMASFRERKKTKINLKSRLKKKVEESPPWIKRLVNFVEVPPTDVILRRMALFVFIGAWSITNSAEGGPAFQVAIALAACIYFLNDKIKSIARASIIGFGSLAVGWFCGSILVPAIPSVLLRPTWTLELLTSLVCYVFLFLGCTFLK